MEAELAAGPQNSKQHSIKVPRLYKQACKGLDDILENGYGLKNAIYSRKHPNVKGITALVTETLRHSEQLEYMLSKSKILREEPKLNKNLAQILITELFWGKKRLSGEAKPVQTVLKYENKLSKALERYQRKRKAEDVYYVHSAAVGNEESEPRRHLNVKPRYVRVNTLKLDLDSAINHFTSEGWIQVEDSASAHPDAFYLDPVVPNLLVFPIGTQFQSHQLYLNGSVILQDKASCLPALALKPRKGRTVLDACAAPGMKTSLLASMMENDGKIIAIEKATKRFSTLQEMLEKYGATMVETMQQDFTNINPNDSKFKDTEYILVDPSCSGSGMTGRVGTHLHCKSDTQAEHEDRLFALSYCQTKLLLHAMKFPNVKRIVYSTCSLYSQENEDVVAAAVGYNNANDGNNGEESESRSGPRHIFRIKEAVPEWPHRLKNQKYEWSSKCITASLEEDGTDGFFVAVIEKVKLKRAF